MGLDVPPPGERHPAPHTALDLARGAALGFAGGLRSMMPLALLAEHVDRQGPDIADGGWAVDLLASSRGVIGFGLAAFGEVIADKLPFVPSRLEPLPLAGRVVLGGTAAALNSLVNGRSSDVGALAGSLGAVLGSLFGYGLRVNVPRLAPVPGLVLALAEDALAFNLARWAVRG